MIDRRRLLLSAVAGVALAGPAGTALARVAAPGSDPAEAAKLNGILDAMFAIILAKSAMAASYMGLDKGDNAAAKTRLDMLTPTDLAEREAFSREYTDKLKAIDASKLAGMDAVNLATVLYDGETTNIGLDRYRFGNTGSPNPYRISQLGGAYREIPDFLDTIHGIETTADAEAYLSRLDAFGDLLDQETVLVREDMGKGIVSPDFVIDRTLTQMKNGLEPAPADSGLVTSLSRRAAEAGVQGDWTTRATAIVADKVYPALQRQVDLFEAARPGARHDAGVWALPHADGYYEYGLRNYTTTRLTGAEVHQLGLTQVAEITAAADAILKAEGMTEGTVGARLAVMAKDPRFIYPNTDAGKQQLLDELNVQMAAMQARLPDYFGILPKASVDIRRVPPAIEAGAPGGYYQGPSLDGSRPGAYYINLRDTAEWPKWTLPTLTYHEAIPGHHLQVTLATEAQGIPTIRKLIGFSAYSEGWALYSEQLADEMGVYADDPWGRLGYLQSLLFRATRLVVDSGLHHNRWSREQAIQYMVATLGDQESSVTTEVERYCVWPGQASSYKVGHTEWVRLREEARTQLGDRFDIKSFHDTALASGSMPLEVLKTVVGEWVESRKA
ncbi:DUF885 family protein [uncultured Brevundimonas sp.]|uniref:DUF885 domain-containing protein n=1 Tax=uncultured Brevundimonas sp. TaxID=213418 RepID=UPI0030ED1F07|tara:strand:- start:4405 stop:6246 length:1842 start_codon:yes stop_codon:yes gene_type:complete